MASLKSTTVNGTLVVTDKIRIKAIEAYSSASTTTSYTTGGSGYVLRSTGSGAYWDYVSDSSAAGSLSSSSTYLVTERDVYYGLPTINGGHSYTSSTNYYIPTAQGTSGQVLSWPSSGSVPIWTTLGPSLPVGGAVGQALVKNAATDGAATWQNGVLEIQSTLTTAAAATMYYLGYFSDNASGYKALKHGDIYIYEAPEPYLNVGSSSVSGGLTLHNANGQYVDFVTSAFGANRVITIPDASGTMALTSSNITGTAANVTGTVAIVNGGTSATTAANATWNLLHVADPGDLNSAKRMGNFKISNTTTNTPAGAMWGATWNIVDDSAGGNNGSSGSTWQLAFQSASSNMWLRCITNAGNWTSWKRFWQVGDAVTGAIWNDYAEYRHSICHEPGYCVQELGDDSLTKTQKRLDHFAGVTSDTWGFAQGETDVAKTPIAVAGRVLVYTFQDRNNYKPGDCVCAAPNGTVDIMTRDEIIQYPDRIVGTVSCVPTYDIWGGGELADRPPVKVNGRIWIKVR